MVGNGEKVVKSLFLKDQGLISQPCRGPLLSIMLFMLMIEMQFTMLVVWSDCGNQSF